MEGRDLELNKTAPAPQVMGETSNHVTANKESMLREGVSEASLCALHKHSEHVTHTGTFNPHENL